MKLITLLLTLTLTCGAAIAQPAKDSAAVTDSTLVILVKDYNEFYNKFLQHLPFKDAQPMIDWWIERINLRIQQWESVRRKKKP